MFDPVSKVWNLKSPLLWVDFVVSALIIAFLLVVVVKVTKRKTVLISGIVLSTLCLASWFLGFSFVWALTIVCIAAYLAVTLIQNQNEIASMFASLFKKKATSDTKKVYDRHAVCQKIALAVETLSRTKTGALITFEKSDSFSEIVKSGTILNAPIAPELLLTIFYPGTRLHDGAVVIRREEILAASVYYTPTTRPLTGKFGSRHRAAIGISEITDSVTVVVSEETGRVSIAYKGELIPVAPDSFLRTLEECIFSTEENAEEEK